VRVCVLQTLLFSTKDCVDEIKRDFCAYLVFIITDDFSGAGYALYESWSTEFTQLHWGPAAGWVEIAIDEGMVTALIGISNIDVWPRGRPVDMVTAAEYIIPDSLYGEIYSDCVSRGLVQWRAIRCATKPCSSNCWRIAEIYEFTNSRYIDRSILRYFAMNSRRPAPK